MLRYAIIDKKSKLDGEIGVVAGWVFNATNEMAKENLFDGTVTDHEAIPSPTGSELGIMGGVGIRNQLNQGRTWIRYGLRIQMGTQMTEVYMDDRAMRLILYTGIIL